MREALRRRILRNRCPGRRRLLRLPPGSSPPMVQGADTVLPEEEDSPDTGESPEKESGDTQRDKFKDILERQFLVNNDVFADVMNVLLFKGRQLVKAEDLESVDPHSVLRFADEFMGQERDLLKLWKTPDGTPIAYLGEESQSVRDKEMGVRELSYDGGTYLWQRKQRAAIMRKNKKLKDQGKAKDVSSVPPLVLVLALTLYFGDKPWKAERLSSKDCVQLPKSWDEKLKSFILGLAPEYKTWIFDIPRLKPRTVKKFTSDFRFVAEYLVSEELMKNGKKPINTGTLDQIVHVEEFAALMYELTKKDLFQNLPKAHEKEGEKPMWTFMIDQAEAADAEIHDQLIKTLLDAGRTEDLRKAAEDPAYKQKLFKDLGIVKKDLWRK